MSSVPRTLLGMQQVLEKYLLETRRKEGLFKEELTRACANAVEASSTGFWREVVRDVDLESWAEGLNLRH